MTMEDRYTQLDIEAVAKEELPEFIGQLEALKAQAYARLHSPAPVKPDPPADRLLTVQDAAEMLAVRPRWIYDNSDKLPFTHRLGAKTLRFSEQGIMRYLERTKP